MLDRILNSLSFFLIRLEEKFGLVLSSLILSIILLCIAGIYVQPVFNVAFHGILFSELSEHPFDFSHVNNLQYRILGPLLGYIFFLRGKLFFLLPIIFILLFPATVYFCYRKKNIASVDAFFLACFISFSCVILLPIVAPAYTDVITWYFIFLAFINANKTIYSSIFFSLALLNHESSTVLFPALLLYAWYLKKNGLLKIILIYLLAFLPHLLFRHFVNLYVNPMYSISFYLSENNIHFVMSKLILFLPAAIFYAFKLLWIIPLCYGAWSFRQKKFLKFSIVTSIIFGGLLLAFIGYDYTRMIVISFPAILISYEWFKEMLDIKKVRKLTFILLVLNFLILQYHFNFDGAQPMFPWVLNKISEHFGIPLV